MKIADKFPKKSTLLEDELATALKIAGYGDVKAKVENFRIMAGYGVDTTMTLTIEVTRASGRSPRKTKPKTPKRYKIVRRNKRNG